MSMIRGTSPLRPLDLHERPQIGAALFTAGPSCCAAERCFAEQDWPAGAPNPLPERTPTSARGNENGHTDTLPRVAPIYAVAPGLTRSGARPACLHRVHAGNWPGQGNSRSLAGIVTYLDISWRCRSSITEKFSRVRTMPIHLGATKHFSIFTAR